VKYRIQYTIRIIRCYMKIIKAGYRILGLLNTSDRLPFVLKFKGRTKVIVSSNSVETVRTSGLSPVRVFFTLQFATRQIVGLRIAM